jgi:GNAT superfamily N-acetyltransferase
VRIREATPVDIPQLQRMGLEFIKGTHYETLFHVTAESLEILAKFLFDIGPQSTILLAEDDAGVIGMLAIVALPAPLSGQLYADEMVWWVDPRRRGWIRVGPALLRSAEDWARARGCYMIKMVAPSGSTIGTFYGRVGFTPLETAYVKVL